MIPIVRGVSELTWESGEDWLRKQPEEVQIKTLGPGAHEMWKNGEIELKDLVNKVEHPIWGPSLQRNTLASLRGEGGLSPLVPDIGPGQWKPNMTSDEAALWASNSKIAGPVYHGTGLTERGIAMSPDDLSARIEAITNEGFIVPEKYTNGNMLGRGVYVIPDPSRAARYGEVLELRINVQNPLILEQQEWSKQYQRIIREMKKAGLNLSPQERITWWVEKEGIDAIQITNALPQIVVFDPKNITVVTP